MQASLGAMTNSSRLLAALHTPPQESFDLLVPVVDGIAQDYGRHAATPLSEVVIFTAGWPGCDLPMPTGKVDDFYRDTQRWASDAQRKLIFERDEARCMSCKLALDWRAFHADHIIEWCKGGLTVVANLQTLCVGCHREKTGTLRKP
jgi:hypothetical protein